MTDQLDRLTAALADRYKLERQLGIGGMATVYLAEDTKLHRQVAVKVAALLTCGCVVTKPSIGHGVPDLGYLG